MKREFLDTLQLDENHERECKLAEGGFPESLWETYSAFANTDGGTILLGVKEHRDSFTVNGLTDRQIAKYQKNFWSVLNDRNKISKNILLNHHVKIVECEGKKLLEIDVPAADRHDKSVYVGTDPNALSEAVANALVHANYYGKRGIVIVKHGKTITISNPGTIRITKEEFYAGGNSDPRNPNLLKIFGFVNVGERAGSGVDKIMTAWEEQNWEKPIYDISLRAERVTLQLEVGQIVYIPGAADLRKENEYNSDDLHPMRNVKEQKIIDYIELNGSITTQIVTSICGYQTKAGARKLLEKMTKNGILQKLGSGPATRYERNNYNRY